MMEAGEKVVVDFLPTDWAGLPPPLPQEIIEELAERARNTELRRAEERKARAHRLGQADPGPFRKAADLHPHGVRLGQADQGARGA